MSILQSLDSVFLIKLGEKLKHPVFGTLEVIFISQVEGDEYEMLCRLEDFNNSLKTFDALTLSKIKFRVNGLRRVK